MSTEKNSEIREKEFKSLLMAPPPVRSAPGWFVPSDEQCADLWTRYEMFDNIAAHSHEVARIATFLAEKAKQVGMNVHVQTVRSSALLHDIAKSYCIKHGGSHSQLGGGWVAEAIGNPAIASGVTHHVYWPFEMNIQNYFTPLAVIYADKRIRHDTVVSIKSRFKDLATRYGTNEHIRSRIEITKTQALELEKLMGETIGVNLNECDFNSGRLV